MTSRSVKTYVLAPVLTAAFMLTGCGDDGGGKPKKPRPRGAKPKTTVIGGAAKGTLVVYRKIDDVAIIESTARCTKKCKDAQVPATCINRCVAKAAWDLRHDFAEKKDSPRDPFHSYVLKTEGNTDGVANTSATAENYCPPKDMRAPDLRPQVMDPRARRSFSYRTLKLKGIIGRGTKRQALFSDSTGYSHIVEKGNCLGKEKARVKEIGVEVVVLEIKTDEAKAPTPLKPIELHPSDVLTDEAIDDANTAGASTTNDVPPKNSPTPGILNRKRGQRPPGIPKRP